MVILLFFPSSPLAAARYNHGMGFWQDKVVLVTGSSSGLGRVIAEQFAAEGSKIVIAALEAEAVERAAGEMQARGRNVLGIQADITRQDDVERMVGRGPLAFRPPGRAGEQCRPLSAQGKVIETTPEQFHELMELNFIALVRCTRAAMPELLAHGGGTW